MWAQGLCFICGEPNDRKGQNFRTCSICVAKEGEELDIEKPEK